MSKIVKDLERRLAGEREADKLFPESVHTQLPGEVAVTQYLRPDGRTRLMYAPIGERHVRMVAEKDLVLSAEELPTGMVALYVRRNDQSVEEENSPPRRLGDRPAPRADSAW